MRILILKKWDSQKILSIKMSASVVLISQFALQVHNCKYCNLFMPKRQGAMDKLNEDALKEILIRVGGHPNGAADIARAFSVCKRFEKFSKDKVVLQAVVFDNLAVSRRFEPFAPDELHNRSTPEFDHLLICSKYEPFQQVDGLIVKCAQAGHPDAQIILAKVIMVTASELLNVKKNLPNSEVSSSVANESFSSQDHEDDKCKKHAKLSSFISHFSNKNIENNDPNSTHHIDLVRTFLCRSTFIELEDMRPYLKDFVSYFVSPEARPLHRPFLHVFEELWRNRTMPLQNARSIILTGMCNAICLRGYTILQGLGADQELLEALKKLVLPHKERFEADHLEWLIQHFAAVEATIQEGLKQAYDAGKKVPEEDGLILEGAVAVRNMILRYTLLASLIEKIRSRIIDEYDGMFGVQSCV